MKKLYLSFCLSMVLTVYISAQKDELITVKAGSKILSYFPLQERYLYPEFMNGRALFKNGFYSERRLNYNYLLGDIEFIQNRDTLSIINKKDIKFIAVEQDTFYYDKGYIKQINGGPMRIGLKDFIELKEVQNKDPYGIASSASSTTSFGSLPLDGNFYKLTANQDMVFQRIRQFYIAVSGNGFILINRKNLLVTFPANGDKIKSYLKSNKVKFDSTDDILKLTDFLRTLNN